MRTLPFVPMAEAAYIADLNDRQMSRLVDENLVPANLLGQQGSSRLFARLVAAFARFYFDTEQTLVASARRGIVEELVGRVQSVPDQQDVLGLRIMSTEINWTVARKSVEIDVLPYVVEAFTRARQVDEAEALVSEDDDIMGGMPCFTNTRVPVEIVLGSLSEGVSLSELRESYAFLTDAHVAAARVYSSVHPRRGRPRRACEASVASKQLIERVIRRPRT